MAFQPDHVGFNLELRDIGWVTWKIAYYFCVSVFQWQNEDDNNNIYLIGSWKEENDLIEAKCLGEYFINTKYDVKCKHFLLFLSTLKWRRKVKIKMKKKRLYGNRERLKVTLTEFGKENWKKKRANKSLQ